MARLNIAQQARAFRKRYGARAIEVASRTRNLAKSVGQKEHWSKVIRALEGARKNPVSGDFYRGFLISANLSRTNFVISKDNVSYAHVKTLDAAKRKIDEFKEMGLGEDIQKNPRRKNPDDYGKVADLYERFTGHEAEPLAKVSAPKIPKVAAVIGTLDFVGYTTVRDGEREKYIHKFRQADKPLLCASPDGKVFLLGGNYDFTERGIVDHSDPN